MKRLLWVVAMLFVVFAPYVYADDILNVNITYVTVSMGPNDGSGDNAFVTLIGPGTEITAVGGMGCFDWCSPGQVIKDLNSVSLSQLFVGPFLTARVLGTTYDVTTEFGLTCCVFSGAFLNPSVMGTAGSGDTFVLLDLTLPSCCEGWNLNFRPEDGGFTFIHGEFTAGTPPAPVPEPGTLALIATGFAGIFLAYRFERAGRVGKAF
jgi:hypothetical protein